MKLGGARSLFLMSQQIIYRFHDRCTIERVLAASVSQDRASYSGTLYGTYQF